MKLVRDRIPRIIQDSGKTTKCHSADLEEFSHRLEDKMKEELTEFMDNPCHEEAADMYEVLRCLCWINNLYMEDVINAADIKRINKGGFTKGIVLEEVIDPRIEDNCTTAPHGEHIEHKD